MRTDPTRERPFNAKSDPDAGKLLACYTLDGDHVFLAMSAESTVSLLTKDGVKRIETPATFKEAMRSSEREKWLESMGIEVQTFKDTNTYTLMPLTDVPKGTPVFQLMWKYRLKRNADGSLDKYKSRCVLMGNRMVQGRDYSESFAVGARMMSIRLIFAICAVYGLIDYTIDIKGAYLHAQRPESGVGSNTYVWQPPGFEETGPNGEKLVGLLNSYVYGDPGAGRAWWFDFNNFLVSDTIGATTTDADPNLGRVERDGAYLVYAKYVDELVIAASTQAILDWFAAAIEAKYPECTCGPWRTILGFGVSRDLKNRTVSVNATKLIHDLADRRGVTMPE